VDLKKTMGSWSTRIKVLLLAVFFSMAVPCAPAGADTLTVAAASSLSFPLKEAAADFEKRSGARLRVSFGSTGTLTSQIRNGAPFDLFLSADTSRVEELEKAGHVVPGSVRVYALGRLVLVVNNASGIEATGLKNVLMDPGIKRVAIANPDHAPYGAAAVEALKAASLWEGVRPKLVYGENIRQTLRFVQTGNAQAGIVSLSIADVPGVSYLQIDAFLHSPIEQAAGVVAASRAKELAKRFLEYLTGPEGAAIMQKYGFVQPGR
jgi:molybdate transport system substrate-binding protein